MEQRAVLIGGALFFLIMNQLVKLAQFKVSIHSAQRPCSSAAFMKYAMLETVPSATKFQEKGRVDLYIPTRYTSRSGTELEGGDAPLDPKFDNFF